MNNLHKYCLILLIFCSCSNSKNKKLLEDSFYIYESKNKSYEYLSQEKYDLDFKTNKLKANELIGAIEIEKLKANKISRLKSDKDNYFVRSNVIINDDWLYFLDPVNNLHKISLENPKEKYVLKIDYNIDSFSSLKKRISHFQNHLIVTSGTNKIININIDKFEINWEKEISNIVRSSLEVDQYHIYISTIDNVLLALDKHNGSIVWKNELDSKQTSIYGSGYLTVVENFLLFTSSLGETVAIDKNNGKTLWLDKINLNNIYASEYDVFDSELKPIIDSNNYISWNYSGNITSYNISNGIRNWLINIRPITNLWLNNDMVFTVTLDHKIIALDKNNGKLIWLKDLADYKKIKQEDFNEANISGIFILNKKLAILSKSGRLMLVDPLNGEYLSKHRFTKNVISLPYVSNEALFLQDKFGNIFKFN